MTISRGDRLPDGSFLEPGPEGPQEVSAKALFAGRKVVVFGLPGAFTRVCSADHLPSFMRTVPAFREKGVDDVACLAVNDPFVLKAWDDATGATRGGVRLLGDPSGSFVRALGLAMDDVAAVGLYGRSRRFAMLVEDGVVTALNIEPDRGCSISAGETFLESI